MHVAVHTMSSRELDPIVDRFGGELHELWDGKVLGDAWCHDIRRVHCLSPGNGIDLHAFRPGM